MLMGAKDRWMVGNWMMDWGVERVEKDADVCGG